MEAVIISIIVFIAILLVLVILAQNSKGGGLSSQFGGSGASNMIGVKKTTDLLEKITWGLAIGMLALTMSLTLIDAPQGTDSLDGLIPESTTPELPLPADGTVLDSSEPIQGLESPTDSLN